jgi:hypothetical protein
MGRDQPTALFLTAAADSKRIQLLAQIFVMVLLCHLSDFGSASVTRIVSFAGSCPVLRSNVCKKNAKE